MDLKRKALIMRLVTVGLWVLAGVVIAGTVWTGRSQMDALGAIRMPETEDPCGVAQADGKDDGGKDREPAPGSKAALAKVLKEKNMFVPPPPKPQPPGAVQAIFGKEALITGKWYKKGDTIPPGAILKEIGATEIVIEWDGDERRLAPIQSAPTGPARPERAEENRGESRPERSPEVREQPAAEPAAEVVEEDELAWLDIPPHLKEKVRRMWAALPDEQKQHARQEWENASDAEREEMLRELEEAEF